MNVQLAPQWTLIPEANLVVNSPKDNNLTLGLRWNASENIAVELYGSTASSIIDLGQLIDAEQVLWGSRIVIKL